MKQSWNGYASSYFPLSLFSIAETVFLNTFRLDYNWFYLLHKEEISKEIDFLNVVLSAFLLLTAWFKERIYQCPILCGYSVLKDEAESA